jgi:hypothetical protein
VTAPVRAFWSSPCMPCVCAFAVCSGRRRSRDQRGARAGRALPGLQGGRQAVRRAHRHQGHQADRRREGERAPSSLVVACMLARMQSAELRFLLRVAFANALLLCRLARQTFEAYERFVRLKNDSSYVECPTCKHSASLLHILLAFAGAVLAGFFFARQHLQDARRFCCHLPLVWCMFPSVAQ